MIEKLEQHRLLQIDENRAVSKSFDELRTLVHENKELIDDLRERMNAISTFLSMRFPDD